MASYIGVWFVGCLARQSSFVIQADSGSCVRGRWYPVYVLRDLLSTTSVDQWGEHALAAAEPYAVNCCEDAVLYALTTGSVP